MKYLAALALIPALSQAAAVFDGYEAYYASLPDRLFQGQGVELEPYSIEGDDETRYGWQGLVAGHKQRLEVRDGRLKINGRLLAPKHVHPFPGEAISDTDLGMGTTAYFASGWMCVENTPASASGTAVRHKAVYLIRRRGKGYEGWKLPSLFAHCAAIRVKGEQVRFDEARYRYVDGQDEAMGASFKEYVLQGLRFVPTGMVRSVTFLERGNVYKFSVDPQ